LIITEAATLTFIYLKRSENKNTILQAIKKFCQKTKKEKVLKMLSIHVLILLRSWSKANPIICLYEILKITKIMAYFFHSLIHGHCGGMQSKQLSLKRKRKKKKLSLISWHISLEK